MVVFVVLMVLWLFGGCWIMWEPTRPYSIGSTILPWLCVAILGWVVFSGGVSVTVIR